MGALPEDDASVRSTADQAPAARGEANPCHSSCVVVQCLQQLIPLLCVKHMDQHVSAARCCQTAAAWAQGRVIQAQDLIVVGWLLHNQLVADTVVHTQIACLVTNGYVAAIWAYAHAAQPGCWLTLSINCSCSMTQRTEGGTTSSPTWWAQAIAKDNDSRYRYCQNIGGTRKNFTALPTSGQACCQQSIKPVTALACTAGPGP